jgi:lipopolysaccharide transport system ATP-binding protein
MSQSSVSVQGLGKAYRMPHPDSGQLRAHMKEFFGLMADERDMFWALRDINLELEAGDIIGILGKNGSGKSTFLKLLSGVTAPTTGRAVLRGRIGSLLEVGAGFHPDLTGRENILMNGSLLGMSQREIRRRLDEIIHFAGIEPFIDMPVKRYSSGMYVRLAYAVASHLDTDILILDEVLAVGDAEFRKKSLDNMERIARGGRTILFVSHNPLAVANLCKTGMVLSEGRSVFQGSARDAMTIYQRMVQRIGTGDDNPETGPSFIDLKGRNGIDGDRPEPLLTSIETCRLDGTPTRIFRTGEGMRIRVGYQVGREPTPCFCILFLNSNGDRVMTLYSTHQTGLSELKGTGIVECIIPDLRIFGNEFSLLVEFARSGAQLVSVDSVPNATTVRIELQDYLGYNGLSENQGSVAQKSNWVLSVNPAV